MQTITRIVVGTAMFVGLACGAVMAQERKDLWWDATHEELVKEFDDYTAKRLPKYEADSSTWIIGMAIRGQTFLVDVSLHDGHKLRDATARAEELPTLIGFYCRSPITNILLRRGFSMQVRFFTQARRLIDQTPVWSVDACKVVRPLYNSPK